MSQNRNLTIDFIKGLAILGIVFCHAVQVIPEINTYVFHFCRFGQNGCQIFFFFTGLLLVLKFNKEFLSFSPFLKKRLGWVMVPWSLAVIIYYCLTNYFVDKQSFPYLTNTSISSIVINLLFLNGLFMSANNNVVLGGWYLGTLTIIWVMFPYLFKLKRKYGNRLLFFGIPSCLLCVVILKLVFGLSIGRNSFLYFSFFTQLPCVIIGMYYSEISENFMSKSKITQLLLTLAIFIVFVVLFYKPINFSAIITPILICLLIAFILPKINVINNKITKAISYLGQKSLYIYLYHVFIVWHFQYYAYKYILSMTEINHTLLFFALLPVELILIIFVSNIVEIINCETKTLYNKIFNQSPK